jgi:hypothetical protein
MNPTFDEWRAQPSQLPEIDVGGFFFNTFSTSLHRIEGRLALAVVDDDATGASVVVALDETQSAAIETLLPFTKERHRQIMDWVRALDIGHNEVIGMTTNEAYRAFAGLLDDPSS